MTFTTAETVRLYGFLTRALAAGALDDVVATGFDRLGFTADQAGEEHYCAEVVLHFEDEDGHEVSSGPLTNGGEGLTRYMALEAMAMIASEVAA